VLHGTAQRTASPDPYSLSPLSAATFFDPKRRHLMGADMVLRTVYLRAGTTFDLPAATAMATTLIGQARSVEFDWLAERYDLDLADDASRADRCQAASDLLTGLLTGFAKSLTSRDVTSYPLGTVSGPVLDEYATGGLSSGDGPTDAYDAWTFLFDNEALPERWGEYLATAGGLLHPNGDGPVVAALAFRAWGHLPA